MELRTLTGQALLDALPEVARLRIAVFRDWPYLYDGDAAYEEAYLRPYAQSAQAIVVGAYDGEALVGASTGAPLKDHAEDFGEAFAGTQIDLDTVFYCAESVLLPLYRGRGVGHGFFDAREAHARHLGFTKSAFCAVMRPEDHPARPATYRPLDSFWTARGYRPCPGVIAAFDWKDIDQTEQTAKPLQFWMRPL